MSTISKNSNVNWKNTNIQFPRLIAEMVATGAFTPRVISELSKEMDLTYDEVWEIVEKAIEIWDTIKLNT